jgi:hypothetical protein
VLISDPTVSGRTFIPKEQLDEYEDLEFVSRATSANSKYNSLSPKWIQSPLDFRFSGFPGLNAPDVHFVVASSPLTDGARPFETTLKY